MKKLICIFALLLAASIIFTSCEKDPAEDPNPIGIGDPTPTTDPGVFIGYLDGEPIRWATRNLDYPGTFAANPEDAGRLFQWGTYNGVVHHWDNTTAAAPADFNTSRNRVAWTAANDPCPTGWRVPTYAELTALRNAGSRWDDTPGINGRFFGTGQNRIFLLVSGWRVSGSGALSHVGMHSIFWSSTELESEHARTLWFSRYAVGVSTRSGRSLAGSVRCVAE